MLHIEYDRYFVVKLCQVMIRYIMSCHVMSCHVMSCHVMSSYVILFYATSQNSSYVSQYYIVHNFFYLKKNVRYLRLVRTLFERTVNCSRTCILDFKDERREEENLKTRM